ncbi:uncharacterized protein LOC133367169 [Rhineura floridana]|uniref:uncharacterized protein LOC133367169 n=1 Tax=Rhineura floridana TaxID=261503 RepID=UPI002AC8787D|nr:uncharacterized protein LOC133367169 [Rhineura floridana]
MRLLHQIQSLHQGNRLRVRLGPNGALSHEIPVGRIVKQGCILAPFLFNFFINDLISIMASPNFSPPAVGNRKIASLLYADDLVLLSQNRIGLKRMLSRLEEYCETHHLLVNYTKTKIMVCGRYSRTKSIWFLNGHQLEQVSTFKYLGICINNNLSWSSQLEMIKLMTLRSNGQLKKFFYSRGGQLLGPMLKIYTAKLLPKILYGVELWGHSVKNKLEVLQNQFMKQILGLSKGTPAAHLRAELGLLSLAARIDLAFLRYWKRSRSLDDSSLIKLCWNDPQGVNDWGEKTRSYYRFTILLQLSS